ncbi:hypothetical protein ACWOFR_10160 [Carnobacterium gallinarum]|uniref:hypothetical protein n=1 Tax=Carnobacterium gallinarum TaxID=2749 RepID=UPI00054F7647|nr:hypothetical protein [Carnobacterium gallinarum]
MQKKFTQSPTYLAEKNYYTVDKGANVLLATGTQWLSEDDVNEPRERILLNSILTIKSTVTKFLDGATVTAADKAKSYYTIGIESHGGTKEKYLLATNVYEIKKTDLVELQYDFGVSNIVLIREGAQLDTSGVAIPTGFKESKGMSFYIVDKRNAVVGLSKFAYKLATGVRWESIGNFSTPSNLVGVGSIVQSKTTPNSYYVANIKYDGAGNKASYLIATQVKELYQQDLRV